MCQCNSEVVRLDVGMDIQEALEDAYSNSGVEWKQLSYAVPTKELNLYNQQIRTRIRGLEDDISTGDFFDGGKE